MIADQDLLSIQQARILAENAHEAQKKLREFSQERLDAIVSAIAEEVVAHTEALAVMSQEETGCGNWRDKCVKNKFVCLQVSAAIRSMRCVGIISRDAEQQTMNVGVPVGVIAAICPVTSPVSTAIYKTLIAIKSGNAIIFSPHPRAIKSISHVLDIMIDAAQRAGLPEGCLAYMNKVSKSGTLELINHRHTGMVLLTGVPGIYEKAVMGTKPIIYGGVGNGPAFIERTANIDRAVKDVIASKTFDNGIAPSAEQSVVIDGAISGEVKAAFIKYGAYYMCEEEAEKILKLFFYTDGRRKKDAVGLDAAALIKRAGITTAPDNVKLLLAQREFISDLDPYSRGFMAPVLPVYIEDDWMGACEKCIELLLFERKAHIMIIHSTDESVIEQFALRKPVARMLVNTPACFGAMGMTTNLFPSMTLGSGSTGHGITADNVSPMNLIYIRKVGYGTKTVDSLPLCECDAVSTSTTDRTFLSTQENAPLIALQRLIAEAFEGIDKTLIK